MGIISVINLARNINSCSDPVLDMVNSQSSNFNNTYGRDTVVLEMEILHLILQYSFNTVNRGVP